MIPFVDLKRQHQELRPQLQAAFARVLDSGHYVLGEEVEAFERQFAAYCGTRHAIALNTGTSALHLALLAAGIRPGDEVITTPMTFVATVAAILYAGARPVFVDVEPGGCLLDTGRLADAVTSRTKAILPVHLHGLMVEMGTVAAVADRFGLAVIEDAAQAHGAAWRGRRAGTLGDLGCFSFYPGKNLGAVGEGGALVTDDLALAERVRRLRDWGQSSKYHHTERGFNYRMDAVQAALLAVKLEQLEGWTEARRRLAGVYDRLLGTYGVGVPAVPPDVEAVYHVYAVRLRGRDAARDHLGRAGIGTGIHYPTPVHLQPAYADLGYRAGDFPHAECYALETLSLPMYPEMEVAQVETVAGELGAFVAAVPA